MEFWMMSYKCILLIYIVSTLLFGTTASLSPWYIFIFLLYLCLNIAANIVKTVRTESILLLLSIALTVASSIYIDPMFILLLPINLYELISSYMNKQGMVLLLLLIAVPLIFLNDDMLISYAFIAMLSFIYYMQLKLQSDRIEGYKENIESMHDRIDILTRSLNDNNEYRRQSEYTIKLEERNRISQEIHDRIGHSMTGALIQMEASKRLLASDQEKASQLLQNAIQISREGIESIRLVLKNTKPPTEQLGINRVRLLIDEFSSNQSIKTALRYEGDIDVITPIHWSIIIGNIKEALTNAMKYAKATTVSIHIQVLHTLIRVEIKDDGKGSDKVIKGLGIIGMEERAASVDGTIIVDGSRGFSVTTLLPTGVK